ncbi:MAG: glycosyltransferase [Candidatus Cloacimonetes bacterium]|nr:glycosyltransferase [Candidatus Cloacimonadota bacterium]
MNLSPIVLFVYNRPWHTRQTIEALQKNELASESELFIYSDGAKIEKDVVKVSEVRDLIKTISGFKSIKIIERDRNWGLADSIINGVTEIINRYGKIIVLEDDIVTSPYFLKFMNDALEFYKDEKKVWHISGWNYPIKTDDLDDVFLWRVMNCWGWGTWANRWVKFEKNVDKVLDSFTKEDVALFDLSNSGVFWKQVLLNKKGKLNTWAIFWYATIFINRGLCANPTISYVSNIGLDGSGMNCAEADFLSTKKLNQNKNVHFLEKLEENINAAERISSHYKTNLSIWNKLRRYLRIK